MWIFGRFHPCTLLRHWRNGCWEDPAAMQKVFFQIMEVLVEVGIKMALQYWDNSGKNQRKQLIALEGATTATPLAV